MLSLLPETSKVIASLFGFVAPKTKDLRDKATGFENAVLEPLYKKVENENSELSTLNPTPPAPPPPPGEVKYDFDGDGKADIGRWRGVATEFKVKNSNGGSYTTTAIGSSSAKPAPADFDGDGKTDAAVFNAGTWNIKQSSNGASVTITGFGQTGDVPFPGNWVGTAAIDAGVYRPSNGTWYFRDASNGNVTSTAFGAAGDIPITGNWDGDSTTDIAVYRNGTWYIQKSSGGNLYLYWGLSYDIPVQGDYDGDGKSDATVFRPTTGTWYILTSSSNWASYSSANWGVWSDQPTPADYNGDGTTDLAVWRPTDGNWYISYGNTYEIHTLGISGDTAVPSAYTKQVGGTASGDVIAAERVKPRNTTGGTNLYSQNFGWGTSLVGLSGRAGLDAGFGIGYNSLVWLKVGNAMYFDPDKGNVTPGFHMGFPVIEPIYYNATRQKWAYMMVTPSGSRIEFLETAASNTYETADSSYAQLVVINADNPFDPVENLSITVTSTDGAQMTYAWGLSSYKCTQIKDRNGNYITLAYDSIARLATMTDTLGRVVTVNYDVNTGLASTITQTWKDNNGQGSNVTHTYATFAYTTKTVDINFGSLGVVGPPDDTVLTVLDKITYADTSWTKFHYNGYLQVEKIENYADDDHKLNHVWTNLASVSGPQSECPRFTETKTYAENFNSGSEVAVTNSFTTGSSYSLPDSISGSATKVTVAVTDHPDNLRTKIYYGSSGYKEGLMLATEDCISDTCSGTDRKRWTWTDWTQDDTSKGYIVNPRVIESRVGDGTNTKRTTVGYGSNGFGLAEEVKVYDTDLTTVFKTQTTSYSSDNAYLNRRIIGLPTETKLYEGTTSGTLMSKVTFGYDGSGYNGSGQSLTSATQHDTTNYGTGFAHRGNLTSTKRWDATDPTNESAWVESTVKYNIAGSPISQTTPWDGTNTRTVSIGYADSWNDGTTRTTYAYPTSLTDPASNSSTVKYRYDIGANVEATSPAPAGQTYGKTTKRIFDSIGRLARNSVYVNTTEKSYVRYEFPSNGILTQTYAPIVDVDADGNIAEDEVYSESWFDGAGRVRKSRTEHPNSTGGWSASQTEYDILGRVYRQSVPTEISVSGTTWTAAGDDASRGWIWNYAYYDWKGRTVRTVPSDSTGSDGKDTLVTYEGCGCAGGQVTTVQGPLVPRDDQPTVNARRTQKAYADILGRTFKTETLTWTGAVYSTVKTTFNGRDQTTLIREYAGSDTSATFQDTTATFDGHGRLVTSHRPEQRDASNNLKYTTYSYNADDSISDVTDGRGIETEYTYNSRGLVTSVGWNVGSTGYTDPADTSFSYDNVDNRTAMTDELGSVSYSYNSLSQMTDETRDFTDSLADSPISGGQFKLEYAYQVGGQLKSYKDPWAKEITYASDKRGRVSSITGTSVGGVTTYVNSPQYRAWGGIKQMSFGDGTQETTTFNNRLMPAHYELVRNTIDIMSKGYEYLSDGKLKFVDDELDGRFDRLMTYDHAGRLREGKSSTEASGTTVTANLDTQLPYRQSYQYDAFNHLTQRNNLHWGTDSWQSISNNRSYTYSNNRVTSGYPDPIYDDDGRAIFISGDGTFGYGARGLLDYIHGDADPATFLTFDGNGKEGRRTPKTWVIDTPTTGHWETGDPTYYIRSSVLGGQVVSEAGPTGKKRQTFVLYGGSKIASQSEWVYNSVTYQAVNFEHSDASGMSQRSTFSNGNVIEEGANYNGAPAEFDPMGGNTGLETPYVEDPPDPPPPDPDYPYLEMNDFEPTYVNGLRVTTMTIDGIRVPYAIGMSMEGLNTHARAPDPIDLSPRRVRNPRSGEVAWGYFHAYQNGMAGWWADTDGPNEGDVDSVHIPWNSNRNAAINGINRVGPRSNPPRPPKVVPGKPIPPINPCPPGSVPLRGQFGVNVSVSAAVAVGGYEIGGSGGSIFADDTNSSTHTPFMAPYGGVVFGGSANGGGVGAPSREGGGLGAFASIGPSIFLSSAKKPSDQAGQFDAHVITLGLFGITVDRTPPEFLKPGDTPVTNISVGPSLGLGYNWFRTHTFRPLESDTNIPGPPCIKN
ncbi:MAG: VCBS repeat-containing protein [Pyrinomonadaceae bacterium]